jgi:hypothetical protein
MRPHTGQPSLQSGFVVSLFVLTEDDETHLANDDAQSTELDPWVWSDRINAEESAPEDETHSIDIGTLILAMDPIGISKHNAD